MAMTTSSSINVKARGRRPEVDAGLERDEFKVVIRLITGNRFMAQTYYNSGFSVNWRKLQKLMTWIDDKSWRAEACSRAGMRLPTPKAKP
jgi:hypothetical protein